MKCEHEKPVFGCDGCIERASVGMTTEGGGKTFRVEAERVLATTFFVVAASKAQAEDDADELADGISSYDWEEVDTSFVIVEATPERGDPVWSGGPTGGWETFKGEEI